jgi:hypothetical protein
VSKLAYICFLLLCLGQVHLYFWLYFSLLAVSRTICSVVTCEGGIYLLSYNPLPSQNPRSPGTSPLGLTSLNRKNHPIEVTLGGIGSVTPVCLFTSTFYPNYKLCDNSKCQKEMKRGYETICLHETFSIDASLLQQDSSTLRAIGKLTLPRCKESVFFMLRYSLNISNFPFA